MRLSALLIAVALGAGGCASGPTMRVGPSVAVGQPVVHSCALPEAVTSTADALPGVLQLPDGATVTDVVEVGAGSIVEGYVDGDPSGLIGAFSEIISAAGLEITAVDDEMREAEISFSGVVSGEVRLGRRACPTDTTGFVIITTDGQP